MRTVLYRIHASRAGVSAPMFALMLPMLVAGVGMAVDGASMALAKNRLQVAADAAAAAAVRQVSTLSAAQAEAQRVAALNLPTATNGNVLVASDVTVGAYDASTRTMGAGTANAVRVVTRFAAANGNAHKVIFGGFLGGTTTDIAASAIALCPTNPNLSQISATIPSRISVVTMGQACNPQSGLTGTCYWATPEGNPIIRVDNWNPAETVITIRITSPAQYVGNFTFTAPYAGQFWVKVGHITMSNAATGAAVNNIVFRVVSSNPVVAASRINTGGTATYNNRFNATATLPGTPICASANQGRASRLVG
jgi:Flp pilus assembly protein TadG